MRRLDPKAVNVSVIIPTYNCAAYVGEAIESVLAQSVRPVQVIVVNDGSTDDTAKAVEPYFHHIEYLHQSNKGVSAARNAGLKRSQGEYVAFLDADDAWYPGKLEQQMSFLKAHPAVAAVFSDFAITGENGNVRDACFIKRNYPIFDSYGLDWTNIFSNREEVAPDSGMATQGGGDQCIYEYWGSAFSSLYLGNFINTSSIVLRKDVLAEVGLFSSTRHTQEDYELWLKVASKYPLGYIDIPLLFTRRRPNQLTSQSEMENIVRVSLEVIEEIAPEARRALGDDIVDKRLSDKHRRLALAQLGRDDRKSARYSLRRSLRYCWTFHAGLLYLWSYVPSSIGARLRALVRG